MKKSNKTKKKSKNVAGSPNSNAANANADLKTNDPASAHCRDASDGQHPCQYTYNNSNASSKTNTPTKTTTASASVESKGDPSPTIRDIDLHTDSLAKWICQFANTELGGVLLFGVNDAAQVAGVDRDYIELLGTKIRNAAEACTPAVRVAMSNVNLTTTATTAFVVAVDIPPSNSLHKDSTGYHIRNGNGALKLEGAALEQALGEKHIGLSSADRQRVEGTTVAHCAPTLLKQFLTTLSTDIPGQLVAWVLHARPASSQWLVFSWFVLTHRCIYPLRRLSALNLLGLIWTKTKS